MSANNRNSNNSNSSALTDEEKQIISKQQQPTHEIIKRITKEIPFFDSDSASVRFLQTKYLFKHCFNNEMTFKQMVAHLVLTVCKHPHNAPLILNISIPLPVIRSIVMDKFRKLDHILTIVTKSLEPSHSAMYRYKNCHYKDIVAHYTRYHFLIPNMKDFTSSANSSNTNTNANNAKNLNLNRLMTGNKTFIAGRYIRKAVLGQNSNLDQFLCAIRDHFSVDHKEFLTISAVRLTTADLDLLCCRYYCICEGLITFEFGSELIVDESHFYRDILQYLHKFVCYCFKMDKKAKHEEFEGLSSDHLKLLMAGTVLLEFGMKKQRPIIREVLNITQENIQYLTEVLKNIKDEKLKTNGNIFGLQRRIVDVTPGSKDIHFRAELDKYFGRIYHEIASFVVRRSTTMA